MKDSPTLIDAVVREALRPHSFIPYEMRQMLLNCRKFTLDDSMSSMLAELSHRPFTVARKTNQGLATSKIMVIEDMRHAARLPHKLTWVEYNAQAYKKYVVENWPKTYTGSISPLEETTPRIGWLLEQHPGIDTAFKATIFAEAMKSPVVLLVAMAWCSEDHPIPWNRLAIRTSNQHSEIACGIKHYASPYISYVLASAVKQTEEAEREAIRRSDVIREFIGELRHIMAFLSTINDLPTVLTQVRPAKGYIARGRYRRFVEHTIITLKVPTNQFRTIAKKALGILKRRRHTVRGHWRKDWRHAGGRIWIHEHERGDAGLGFVFHDYRVTHETGSDPSSPAKTDGG